MLQRRLQALEESVTQVKTCLSEQNGDTKSYQSPRKESVTPLQTQPEMAY
jgi:hypothetical protein